MEEYLTEEYIVVYVACVVLLWLLLTVYNDPRRKEARLLRKKGKAMEDARRAYLYQHLSDLVTEGLENSVYAATISRKEAHGLYTWMGKQLGIKDFYPIFKIRQMLKFDIQRRFNDPRLYFDKDGCRLPPIVFPDCPGWVIRFQYRNQPTNRS